ncbi:putative fumarylacetoacetate hydrolase family protein [Neofusicoccum parvum UCRNP2]|uniref:Putative fumarylacetoacetate hydrolase family protein n=1 Tax=Botryosphaeria parva (strain UCR-NP2) TaxID=1287680 RepID=R1GDD1_BOTPV|nr:putative fumarylacetoacetate hydrolase family protein [Neofusicoccum parvum UCRNP2]
MTALYFGETSLEELLELSPEEESRAEEHTGDVDSVLEIDPSAQIPEDIFVNYSVDLRLLDDGQSSASASTQPTCWSGTFGSPGWVTISAQLRAELVRLYFSNVHPICPIIDEHRFWELYSSVSDDVFSARFPSILFQSMLFAAFAHANNGQLRAAGYQSSQDAQAEYYGILKSAQVQASNEVDEIVLAKTALLLSFWCPPQVDVMINSFWADRAFHHTKQFLRKWARRENTPVPKRPGIVHWCCIIRSTLISYSMRRPYQLHVDEEPLCDPEEVRAEFGLEALFHNFATPEEKLRMIDDFVATCKLSKNLNMILRSQRALLFEMHWTPAAVDDESVAMTDVLQDHMTAYLSASNQEAELQDLLRRTAWTLLPTVTFMVEQNCRKFGLPESSEAYEESAVDGSSARENDGAHVRELGQLMALAHLLSPRFRTARDVWALTQDIDQLLCSEVATMRMQLEEGQIFYGDLLESSGTSFKVNKLKGGLADGFSAAGSEPVAVQKLLCPLERTPIIQCVGVNYQKHAAEAKLSVPKYPVIFTKPADALAGPHQAIPIHADAQTMLDYEGELAVVVGRDAKDVDESDALDYVLGYAAANDISARNFQVPDASGGQYSYAKSFDSFAPVGPAIVSPRAVPDPQRLTLVTRVNGEERQRTGTDDMIWSVRQIVAHLSRGTTLRAGTVIMTGTPAGVGFFHKKFLRDGDVVEVEIEGLGAIANKMAFTKLA